MSAQKPRKIGSDTPKNTGNMGKGRPKGSRNKVTTEVKEMILQALDKAGGVEYLTKQAKENPASFMTLVGKVLPLQVNSDTNHTFSQLPSKVDDFL